MISYQYFAFLDVLGYKKLLEHDVKNNEVVFKDKLVKAFRVFDDVNQTDFTYKSISDSILIRCTAETPIFAFFVLLKKVFISFLKADLLIRGGVAYNQHFENTNITYSKAIADAYDIEQKQSIYPRIVIADSVISMAKTNKQLERIKKAKLLLKDGNLFQLNIIDNANWVIVFKLVKQLYTSNAQEIDSDPALRAKYSWFQNYLFSKKPAKINKIRFLADFEELE